MTKILMCNPVHYGVEYEINPWMSVQNQPDRNLARRQWENLVILLERLGVTICEMSGRPNLPDIVFTANAGLVFPGKKVVLSRFKHPERQPEREVYREWFEKNGYTVVEPLYAEDNLCFEGAGDALFLATNEEYFGNVLYMGYGFRSDYKAVTLGWGSIWRETTCYLELIDPYFYHLDTCFCPLKDELALIWPGAFHPDRVDSISSRLYLLKVPEEDARKFACNAVCVGNNVVIPSGCPTTAEMLDRAGYDVHETDMSEFIKAGGACKCLTLRIE